MDSLSKVESLLSRIKASSEEEFLQKFKLSGRGKDLVLNDLNSFYQTFTSTTQIERASITRKDTPQSKLWLKSLKTGLDLIDAINNSAKKFKIDSNAKAGDTGHAHLDENKVTFNLTSLKNDTSRFFTKGGDLMTFSLNRTLIHELVHLAQNKLDNFSYRDLVTAPGQLTRGFYPEGDTVRITNHIMRFWDWREEPLPLGNKFQFDDKLDRYGYESVIERRYIDEIGNHLFQGKIGDSFFGVTAEGAKEHYLVYNGTSNSGRADRDAEKDFWRRGRIDLTRLGFNAFQPLDKDTIIHLYDTSGKSIDVTGSIYEDILYGFEGDDKINGGFGNDYINGGRGKDKINGGYQSDILYGGDGSDIISGDCHKDLIIASKGNDQIIGSDCATSTSVEDIYVAHGNYDDYYIAPVPDLTNDGTDTTSYFKIKDLRLDDNHGTDLLIDIDKVFFRGSADYVDLLDKGKYKHVTGKKCTKDCMRNSTKKIDQAHKKNGNLLLSVEFRKKPKEISINSETLRIERSHRGRKVDVYLNEFTKRKETAKLSIKNCKGKTSTYTFELQRRRQCPKGEYLSPCGTCIKPLTAFGCAFPRCYAAEDPLFDIQVASVVDQVFESQVGII